MTSSRRYFPSMGISRRRKPGSGAWRLMARFGRTGSAMSFSRAGRIPTVESVSFLGAMAKPSGSMRIRRARTVAS